MFFPFRGSSYLVPYAVESAANCLHYCETSSNVKTRGLEFRIMLGHGIKLVT